MLLSIRKTSRKAREGLLPQVSSLLMKIYFTCCNLKVPTYTIQFVKGTILHIIGICRGQSFQS
jgi:hypothetical protein